MLRVVFGLLDPLLELLQVFFEVVFVLLSAFYAKPHLSAVLQRHNWQPGIGVGNDRRIIFVRRHFKVRNLRVVKIPRLAGRRLEVGWRSLNIVLGSRLRPSGCRLFGSELTGHYFPFDACIYLIVQRYPAI